MGEERRWPPAHPSARGRPARLLPSAPPGHRSRVVEETLAGLQPVADRDQFLAYPSAYTSRRRSSSFARTIRSASAARRRSRKLRIPTNRPSSTTGRCRKPPSSMMWLASRVSVLGVIEIGSWVMHPSSVVLHGTNPRATDPGTSRSVTIPTTDAPRVTTTAPTRRGLMRLQGIDEVEELLGPDPATHELAPVHQTRPSRVTCTEA